MTNSRNKRRQKLKKEYREKLSVQEEAQTAPEGLTPEKLQENIKKFKENVKNNKIVCLKKNLLKNNNVKIDKKEKLIEMLRKKLQIKNKKREEIQKKENEAPEIAENHPTDKRKTASKKPRVSKNIEANKWSKINKNDETAGKPYSSHMVENEKTIGVTKPSKNLLTSDDSDPSKFSDTVSTFTTKYPACPSANWKKKREDLVSICFTHHNKKTLNNVALSNGISF